VFVAWAIVRNYEKSSVGLVLLTASLAIGYSDRGRDAVAVVPNACVMYECKTVYAIWNGNQSTSVTAYKVVGQPATNWNQAWANIYTTSSTEKLPQSNNGSIDAYYYHSCNPQCGKDGNGHWQAVQEVAPAGAKGDIIASDFTRSVCTHNPGLAVIISDLSNSNTTEQTPPGGE